MPSGAAAAASRPPCRPRAELPGIEAIGLATPRPAPRTADRRSRPPPATSRAPSAATPASPAAAVRAAGATAAPSRVSNSASHSPRATAPFENTPTKLSTRPSVVWICATESTRRPASRAALAVTGPMHMIRACAGNTKPGSCCRMLFMKCVTVEPLVKSTASTPRRMSSITVTVHLRRHGPIDGEDHHRGTATLEDLHRLLARDLGARQEHAVTGNDCEPFGQRVSDELVRHEVGRRTPCGERACRRGTHRGDFDAAQVRGCLARVCPAPAEISTASVLVNTTQSNDAIPAIASSRGRRSPTGSILIAGAQMGVAPNAASRSHSGSASARARVTTTRRPSRTPFWAASPAEEVRPRNSVRIDCAPSSSALRREPASEHPAVLRLVFHANDAPAVGRGDHSGHAQDALFPRARMPRSAPSIRRPGAEGTPVRPPPPRVPPAHRSPRAGGAFPCPPCGTAPRALPGPARGASLPPGSIRSRGWRVRGASLRPPPATRRRTHRRAPCAPSCPRSRGLASPEDRGVEPATGPGGGGCSFRRPHRVGAWRASRRCARPRSRAGRCGW